MFFEDRIALLTTLALVEFVLLWAWARWRTRRTRQLASGGFVAACLLLAAQSLVLTDREKIITVCKEMACAIEEGDVDGVGEHIAQEFVVGSIDRETLLAALRRILAQVRVEDPRLRRFEVTVGGGRGHADFHARCRLVTPDAVESALLTGWRLTFEHIDDRWQVVEIAPVPTAMFPYRTLVDVLRAR